MLRPPRIPTCMLATMIAAGVVPAQDANEPTVREAREVFEASWKTNTKARALRLRIPAPRGLITDRHGKPLAQSRVVRQAAINFPYLHEASDAEILAFARNQFATANRALGTTHNLPDEAILTHYKNRRWLPLTFTPVLKAEEETKLAPLVSKQLFLHASYERFYPNGPLAAHMIGYVGKIGWFPTGPAENGDPLWEDSEGREGLELAMEKDLRGKEGTLSALFAADGSKIAWETETKPVPGHSIVTTLDLDMQRRAESILAANSKRGAFVVMDVATGEVLAMASWPSFDPNIYIPAISQADQEKLANDPGKPQLARAYQSKYPPASVYKCMVGLAGLDSGTITADTLLSGPPSLAVGNRVFNNWSKTHEGEIDLQKALARSCNTWFYQVALKAGGDPLLKVSSSFGFGQPTGLPLNETRGFVPDHAWAKRTMGTPRMVGGTLANFAIGQGALATSPLQVARMMAGLGNGVELPPARLVRQIQDINHNIVSSPKQSGSPLPYSAKDIATIRMGMKDVVNASYGTGKSAGIKAAVVGGKTGTGQWIVQKDQYVAWFAGLVPIDQPKYAFAILYEGSPGQTVSGGKFAAPLAAEFFGPLMAAEAKASKELLASAKNQAIEEAMREADAAAKKRQNDEATASEGGNAELDDEARAVAAEVMRGIPVQVQPAKPVEQQPQPKPGFFKRLFGGKQ